jgi:hypothetical protein
MRQKEQPEVASSDWSFGRQPEAKRSDCDLGEHSGMFPDETTASYAWKAEATAPLWQLLDALNAADDPAGTIVAAS